MKALVLAAGLPQIALIKELKSRGIYVVLVDYYPNPIAKPYADKFYQISTLDIPAVTQVAKEETVDFILTVCTDQALLTVSKVSETLGLPCYIDYQTGLNVTNKSYMKQVFEKNNISTARFAIMEQLDPQKISHLQYPLIVKPVDCNSSKGVQRVNDLDSLKTAFSEAVRLSRTDNAIVEEFIEGQELSVDVYVENGTAHILATSQLDKIPEKDKFIIFRSKAPSYLSRVVHDKIQTAAQQIADAFSIYNGPMLIQLIQSDSNIYILEFSARTGGGEKFATIKRLSGFDVIKAVVDLTMGNIPHVEIATNSLFYASEFIYCKPGVFDRIVGLEELQKSDNITDFYLFKTSGSIMDGINSSGDRVAGFSIYAQTKEELEEKHNIILKKLQVLDTNGNNIMRYDLLPPLYTN